jgi:hypothetical protein
MRPSAQLSIAGFQFGVLKRIVRFNSGGFSVSGSKCSPPRSVRERRLFPGNYPSSLLRWTGLRKANDVEKDNQSGMISET